VYIPNHFAVDDEQSLRFVKSIQAADLVTSTADGLTATFLPLLFEPSGGPRGSLCGHVARPNDQWRSVSVGEAMVIAHGPNFYVSPSWYPSKVAHGRVVPTWNYATAHVFGELKIHDDAEWVGSLVRRLTDAHEAARVAPWSVDDAPTDFVAGQLRAIVGVELVISRVEVKIKMSQNRPEADIDGVVLGLAEQGDQVAAQMVAEFRP
jgi:transcriptional regulator